MSLPETAVETPAGRIIHRDAVLPTATPGIVLWRYPRHVIRYRDGSSVRSRSYSVTHEPSGTALLSGTDGQARHATDAAAARHAAAVLGDVRHRGRPFDWTRPIEAIKDDRRARLACLLVGGWRLLSERYDAETIAWAERNGIKLEW